MLKELMPRWRKSKTINQLYKTYKYSKDKEHPYFVDKKTHTAIMDDFFMCIQEHLISGKTYYIPYGMGEFKIHKFKPRKVRPRNYNAEKKYHAETGEWKKIYFQNFHSDGYKMKFGWFNKNYPTIPAKRFYRFEFNRQLRKRLAEKLHIDGDTSAYLKSTQNTKLSKTKTLI